MAFTETLAPFFADFGVTASLGATSVVGIFEEAPVLAFGGAVTGNDPRFTLPTSNLPADPRNVTLTIGARVFNVRDWSNDGTGMSVLELEAA